MGHAVGATPQAPVRHSRVDWIWPLAIILIVVLFVPMRRYTLPVNLPFELEPYRVIVAVVIVLWALSLLAQPDVAIRRSGLDGPVIAFTLSLLFSDFANPGRVAEWQSFVVRALMLSLSMVVVFYLVISVVRTFAEVLAVVKVLVVGTSVLAVLAMIESRTGWSPFANMERFVPLLQQTVVFEDEARGATLRAAGSAEHPIALGALFAIVVPLALYLAIRFSPLWWLSVTLLMAGTFGTVSRTATVMLAVVSAVVLVLRFRETWRLAPLLIPVVVVMVHFSVPGALGSIKLSFFPAEGLVTQQSGDEFVAGSGRLADVGPSLALVRQKPVFGYGYGTLKTDGPDANARILDDQWLSTLLNTGLLGVASLVWLLARFISGVGRTAHRQRGVDGWLLVGVLASVVAFGVGMFTFDAFAFTQVTFVFFVILALGSALALAPDPVPVPSFEPSPGSDFHPTPSRTRRPALSTE